MDVLIDRAPVNKQAAIAVRKKKKVAANRIKKPVNLRIPKGRRCKYCSFYVEDTDLAMARHINKRHKTAAN